MTEERITETRTPSGDTHTTHTVVTDGESRRSGGSGWVIALIVLVLAIGAIFIFSQMSGAEVAKDNAVAGAANEVGEAAQEAGEAVENAVQN